MDTVYALFSINSVYSLGWLTVLPHHFHSYGLAHLDLQVYLYVQSICFGGVLLLWRIVCICMSKSWRGRKWLILRLRFSMSPCVWFHRCLSSRQACVPGDFTPDLALQKQRWRSVVLFLQRTFFLGFGMCDHQMAHPRDVS